ncbi:MAG TPA: dienelactone hydrolase family protein, partial [Candidatus Dormibacteraeota bacterium]|nr:dienelactone hydrolase family protein [Candidatus Dormibacteraeota bacterium]
MGQMIEFTRPDGKKAPGYLALPERAQEAPGIVVIEEWWGVNDQLKGIADAYAAVGYRALVPDLYRGRVAATGDEANHLMQGLDFTDATTQDIRGAVQFLKAQGGKVGVTGYCMGGALALASAMHVPEADAAVVFYGFPPAETGDPATIKIPLIGHWALHDEFFNAEGVKQIEERLKAGRVSYEFFWYDASHAFCNPGGLGNYKDAEAKLAWQRSLDFWKR